MWGPQYDFDAGNRYTGQFYEQSTGRGIVAWKGQVVRTEKGKNPRLDRDARRARRDRLVYKPNEWNELHIIAMGNTLTHILNGHILSVLDRRGSDLSAEVGRHRTRGRGHWQVVYAEHLVEEMN